MLAPVKAAPGCALRAASGGGLRPALTAAARDPPGEDGRDGETAPFDRTEKLVQDSDATSNGRNKYQSRENRAKVRQVLMDSWDPIGVREVPEAQDEYDAYVGRVYVMLMDEKASAEEIADWLYAVATGHMGLSPSIWLEERGRETAEALVALRPGFATH